MNDTRIKILFPGVFRVTPGFFGVTIIVKPPKILQMIQSRYTSQKQIEFFAANKRKVF